MRLINCLINNILVKGFQSVKLEELKLPILESATSSKKQAWQNFQFYVDSGIHESFKDTAGYHALLQTQVGINGSPQLVFY